MHRRAATCVHTIGNKVHRKRRFFLRGKREIKNASVSDDVAHARFLRLVNRNEPRLLDNAMQSTACGRLWVNLLSRAELLFSPPEFFLDLCTKNARTFFRVVYVLGTLSFQTFF